MSIPQKSIFEEIPQTDLFHKINDVCAVVDFVNSNEKLFEITLHKIMALFGANRGSIFILKEGSRDLVLAIAVGMQRSEEKEMVKRMGGGIVGKVAEEKRPIVVEDIAKDGRFANFKARKGYRTSSFICAPLMIKDDFVGVINITDKESGLHFNANEMQLLDFLSSQIALNYRRIQLYQKFQKSIKEAQSLKDKLGQSDQEAVYLKKQIYIQEKLATLGKLAGGIAHEFNNPLDGVMRYTNLSLEHVHDDVVRGYLLEVKHGLDRMANIVKNLLACTRNQSLSTERADFKEALDYALASLKAEIAHKNIEVEKKIQDRVPSILDLGIEGILTNLLRNAADAVDEGGKITVQAKYTDNILTIIVSDTGRGISKEEAEQIFEPFFTTKDMDKGCGLGLTIVAEIIKSYDGKIHVESKPGNGTVFTINLPVKE
ncbi:MAG: GAF domain-containing sensor histidine kinase [Candidatus Omnitrophica bacterium]|nr:GAF domain-containing sensor histidine kinase [Candidatus Omnitrophota bacterium]